MGVDANRTCSQSMDFSPPSNTAPSLSLKAQTLCQTQEEISLLTINKIIKETYTKRVKGIFPLKFIIHIPYLADGALFSNSN